MTSTVAGRWAAAPRKEVSGGASGGVVPRSTTVGVISATCRRGHPWRPETTDTYPIGADRTGRRCAVCRREAARWRYHLAKGRSTPPPAPVPKTFAPVSTAIEDALRVAGPLTIHALRRRLGYRSSVEAVRRRLLVLRRRGLVVAERRRGNLWLWRCAS